MKHEATIRWAGDMTFIGKAGTNHLVPMDTTAEFGGSSSATKPLELLLIGLGGCTGMDIVSLLRKMRVNFSGVTMNISAERAEEHPTVYTGIAIEYVVTGTDVDADKVKRTIELSQEKYCSVSAMLRKSCPVTWTHRIVEA